MGTGACTGICKAAANAGAQSSAVAAGTIDIWRSTILFIGIYRLILLERFVPATTYDSGFEHRLILRLRGGDRAGWSTAFDLYGDRIYGYARRALGHREDAEDVTAETFERAMERIAGFRGDSPLIAWLFAIARNLCLDRQRQPRLTGMELEEEVADETATEARMETKVLVRQALERLSPEHQMVLLLCDVDEWDAKEVMLALNRSLASTKSMLYRARRNLRDLLAEAGMGEECV